MAGKWIKQIDKEKFYRSLEMFLRAETSLKNAAKMVGLSTPTLRKYYEMAIAGRPLPDNLFKE